MKDLFTFPQLKKWKLVLLIVSVLCFSPGIFAQLNGSYTLGSGEDYATFAEAFDALHTQGVSGPVIFNVQSGTYTEQVVYRHVPGASESNTITFRSASGDSMDVVLQSVAASGSNNYVLKLDSAEYVSFHSITFRSENSTYSNVVVLEDTITHVTFSHCVFRSYYLHWDNNKPPKVLISSLNIPIDSITLENNYFSQGSKGVYFHGYHLREGIRIYNNRFDSLGNTAVYLEKADAPLISGNSINWCDNGVLLTQSQGKATIDKNEINIDQTGISINNFISSDGEEALISNNIISVNKRKNVNYGLTGVRLVNSSHIKVYNNTMVNYHNGGYAGSALRIEACDGSTIEVLNNNLVNMMEGYAFYSESTGNLKRFDYNNFYSPGPVFAVWDQINCKTFEDFRSASGDNVHSVFAWPGFTGEDDLYARSAWLDGKGTPLTEVTEDIDGNNRDSSHPDIGANEFTAPPEAGPPLSGIKTVGTTGNYSTLQAAIDDARLKGLSDTLRLQLLRGEHNEQCIIEPIAGASSQHRVIIESATGNAAGATLQYNATVSNNYVVKLMGSSFVTIRNLTLRSLNNRYSNVLVMNGMVDDLEVESCNLMSDHASAYGNNFGQAYMVLSKSDFYRQSFIGNKFDNDNYAVYIYPIYETQGEFVFDHNEITNCKKNIVLRYVSAVITNNLITSSQNGIEISDEKGKLLLHNNKILAPSGLGIKLYHCDFSASQPGVIYNNFIVCDGDNLGYGMGIENGKNLNIYYNSVSMRSSSSNPYTFPIYINNQETTDLKNNIFSSFGSFPAIRAANSTFSSADNNCYYSEGSVLGYWDQDCADLAAIRTASGMNEHSVNADPGFVSDTDLHVTAAALDSAGVPITGITEDIDGDPRDGQKPDIGADEFGAAPSNYPPVAVNDSAEVVRGHSVTLDLLINDSDPDQDSIYVSDITSSVHGADSLVQHRTLIYTADSVYAGMDSLKYFLKDIHDATDSAWVIIHILEGNHPPVAVNDTVTVMQGGSVRIAVLANDSDPDGDVIHLSRILTPAEGEITATVHDTVTYHAPADDFTGMDSVIYYIEDPAKATDSAWIFIRVTEAPNRPPVAEDDHASVIQGEEVVIDVLANDHDPDGDSLILVDVLDPQEGTVQWSQSTAGRITYTAPQNGFAGEVSFQYLMRDERGLKDSAMVYVGVSENVFAASGDDLEQLALGCGLLGDYDADGKMDLIVGGIGANNSYRLLLYINEEGSYPSATLITTIRPGQFDALAWGDFDNDNDPDLIVSGYENTGFVRPPVTKLFRADGGAFREVSTNIIESNVGSVDWGDYDHDGDLDLLTGGDAARLYRNDGPGDDNSWVFTEVMTLPDVVEGSVKWGDYDGDGNPDILLSSTRITDTRIRLYRNNDDGSFTEDSTGIDNMSGRCIWYDFDHDGDPDIIFEGRHYDTVVTKIFRNDLDGERRVFTDIHAGLTGLDAGSISFCDYNLDGDADLLITGRDAEGVPRTLLYDYEWKDRFVPSAYTLPGVEMGSGTWGDVNNDGKPDLLLAGTGEDPDHPGTNKPFSVVFLNHTTGSNTPPTRPSGLKEEISGAAIVLSWGPSTDGQSNARALTYNLRMGTQPGSSDVISPMADPETGKMYIPVAGNAGYHLQWRVNNLELGETYYWSVESVDPAFAASGYQTERSFVMESDYFSENASHPEGLMYGDVAWGDYDNDGDLDLAMTGKNNDGEIVACIYQNTNGYFAKVGKGLQGMWKSSLDWGDFDHDGDLDLIISGCTTESDLSAKTVIYGNLGKNTFADIEADILSAYDGDVAWGDCDNDGDLDVLVTGKYTSSVSATKIYINDNGVFRLDMENSFPGVSKSTVAWCDYDNDMDLDFLLTGIDDQGNILSKIYRNDGGIFTENSEVKLPGVYDGAGVWCDFNKDGRPDILLTGNSGDGSLTKIYLNNGEGFYSIIDVPEDPAINSSVAWGDIDCDGTPEMVIGSPAGVFVYRKYAGFRKVVSLPGIGDGAVALGDYNGDGRLDLVLTGHDDLQRAYCKIYNNHVMGPYGTNWPPSTPGGLEAYNNSNSVVLHWQKAGDRESSHDGLSYNLRIGTTPGGSQIVSPMADTATGTRYVAQMGNAGESTSWEITGLEPHTTLYWSVQAVDPGHLGSEFAPEESVTWVPSYTVRGKMFLAGGAGILDQARVRVVSFDEHGVVSGTIQTKVEGTNEYEIEHVPEGLMTVHAIPDAEFYADFMSIYYLNKERFEDADKVFLVSDTTLHDIYSRHRPMNYTPHTGYVSGGVNVTGKVTVVSNSGCYGMWKSASTDSLLPAKNVWIYLYDSYGDMAAAVVTDSQGNLEFDSIPVGHYYMYIDYTGHPMDPGNDSLLLDDKDHSYNVKATVTDSTITLTVEDVTAVEDHPQVSGITVWPNPVREELFVRFDRRNDREVTVRIISMDGSVCKVLHYGPVPAGAVKNISLSDLPPGVYIFSVDGQHVNYRHRIIKVR